MDGKPHSGTSALTPSSGVVRTDRVAANPVEVAASAIARTIRTNFPTGLLIEFWRVIALYDDDDERISAIVREQGQLAVV